MSDKFVAQLGTFLGSVRSVGIQLVVIVAFFARVHELNALWSAQTAQA